MSLNNNGFAMEPVRLGVISSLHKEVGVMSLFNCCCYGYQTLNIQ